MSAQSNGALLSPPRAIHALAPERQVPCCPTDPRYVREMCSQMASANETLAELEPAERLEAESAFGVSFEWFALHGKCFSHRQGTFDYKLCPFGTFSQDGRILGTYAGWRQQQAVDAAGQQVTTATAVMDFEGGEECDGTPRRASVRFTCAEADSLLKVEEPTTCVYHAAFATPSACSVNSLREQHEALAAAAADAGLEYAPSESLRGLLRL